MENNNLGYDILKEIFNIGVGRAADMLSQMIDKKILLDVPNIEIINDYSKPINLEDYLSAGIKGTLMVSSISFQEELNGEANLVFPAEKMKTVISLCLGEEEKEEDDKFTDIDFDVIREIGNIILNSIIGEIGNFLNKELEYTLPNIRIFEMDEFECSINKEDDKNSLLLSISFIIDSVKVEGAVIINFTIKSLKEIMNMVTKMGEELNG